MKKFLIGFLAIVLCISALCGCGGSATGKGKEASAVISADTVKSNLREFLGVTSDNIDGNTGNRAPSSVSENSMARKLAAKYDNKSAYPDFEVTPLNEYEDESEDRTRYFVSYDGETRPSYNVEIRLPNPRNGYGDEFKQVIIGAGYGNGYGYPDEPYADGPATGAMQYGASAATLMSIIDYCSTNAESLFNTIDFDIVFVFFGGTDNNSRGASTYVEHMKPEELLGTLLMFNIGRLGGDKMYLYSDEVKTDHEKYLRGIADGCGLEFYDMPSNMPLIDGIFIEDVYYTHFGMIGDHAPFIEQYVPAASLFSGSYGGFNLSDLESSGKANVGGTDKDNYMYIAENRPQAFEQGSSAATLILESICGENFAAVMSAARDNIPDYSFWVNPFWAYMTVIFIVIALSVVLIILVKHFEKKYPYVPKVRRMKIAVFGMEYENKEDGDIFIELRRRPRNPFDGY